MRCASVAEDRNVRILAWPDEAAKVENRFRFDEPCPVSISFKEQPANVSLLTDLDAPIFTEMEMRLSAADDIPVCISVCEPICAESRYRIGFEVFDEPVAKIDLSGVTKLGPCDDDERDDGKDDDRKVTCVGFSQLTVATRFHAPFDHEGLRIEPSNDPVYIDTLGEPAGQHKLRFGNDGVRIVFPSEVSDVSLRVNKYNPNLLEIRVFVGTHLVDTLAPVIDNAVVVVDVDHVGVTALELRGGANEATIVEICFREIP